MPVDVRTWGVRLFGSLFRRFVTLKAGTNVTITETTSGNEATLEISASGGGGGGAPTTAQYVTLATDATLTNERVLTAGHGVDLVDGGAGSTITVDVDETELSHASLGDRAWSSSGHTGTASRLAAFDGGGAASYLQLGVDVQAYSATLASLAGLTLFAGDVLVASGSGTLTRVAAGSEGTSLTIVSGTPAWVALGVAVAIQSIGGTDTPLPADASFVDNADGNGEAFLSFQVP